MPPLQTHIPHIRLSIKRSGGETHAVTRQNLAYNGLEFVDQKKDEKKGSGKMPGSNDSRGNSRAMGVGGRPCMAHL